MNIYVDVLKTLSGSQDSKCGKYVVFLLQSCCFFYRVILFFIRLIVECIRRLSRRNYMFTLSLNVSVLVSGR